MIDLGKLERILSLMQQFGVEFVQAEQGPEKFCVSKTTPSGILNNSIGSNVSSSTGALVQNSSASAPSLGNGAALLPQSNLNQPHSPSASAGSSAPAPTGNIQKSPVVGTFYRSPSPDSKSFVDVGSKVKKGQTLCIVEAMKLMNEIESEFDGTITAVLVENGKIVEFDTPLFQITP
jgi:acetyl-CoA carboxylase biotin carboxyl carrier protein